MKPTDPTPPNPKVIEQSSINSISRRSNVFAKRSPAHQPFRTQARILPNCNRQPICARRRHLRHSAFASLPLCVEVIDSFLNCGHWLRGFAVFQLHRIVHLPIGRFEVCTK
ncbi:MAG: hypothetical protein WD875_06765 [Pirellulales bacterium]